MNEVSEKKTRAEFGTPYSIGEAEAFLEAHGDRMDCYLRELFAWLCAVARRQEGALENIVTAEDPRDMYETAKEALEAKGPS